MVQKRCMVFIIHLVILICFLLGSGCTESGSHPISSETSGIAPGQNVTVGFTVLDAAKRPVITTEKQVFTSAYEKGDLVFFSDLIRIPSNTTSGIDIVKLPVSHPGINGTTTFALFGPELDAISYGVVGMKPGETKIISNPMGTNLVRTIDNEKFPGIVGDEFAEATIGDQVPIAFSDTPIIAVDDAVIQVPLRTATILERNEQGVTISYGYPFIEVYLKDTGI
jgi:hypothetical protein